MGIRFVTTRCERGERRNASRKLFSAAANSPRWYSTRPSSQGPIGVARIEADRALGVDQGAVVAPEPVAKLRPLLDHRLVLESGFERSAQRRLRFLRLIRGDPHPGQAEPGARVLRLHFAQRLEVQ